MTDHLSPAEEAAVRDRLAEARHTGPVPADVAARLDAVLAGLTADRRAEREPARVVPLPTPASRRRRVVAGGLAAAAAVVALGVAVPQVLDQGTSGGGDSSASTADRDESAAGAGSGSASDRSSASEGFGATAPSPGTGSGSPYAGPLVLGSGEPLRPAVLPLLSGIPEAAYDVEPGCVPDVRAGDLVAATWDGAPAVVVLRPARAGRRLIEVYVCGSGEVVGRISLPAR
jgi:hypothetical protein